MRRAAHDAGEETGEIVRVVDADLVAELIDADVSVFEHAACFFYFQTVEIVEWALPGVPSEKGREM